MKSSKTFGYLAIASSAVLASIYFSFDRKQDTVEVKSIRDVSVQSDLFVFDASKSFALHTKEGSVVYIAENSFQFKDGSELEGDVEISFKEYHNVIDVIKSRVKMSYDSAGVRYHLQSAGMFDVSGESEGREVELKAGKSLQVDLLTNTNGGKFNFYKFENDSWNFVHKDMSFSNQDERRVADLEESILNVNNRIKEITTEMPLKPKRIDNNKLNVKIDFNAEEFPELAAFNDVLFEFVDDKLNAKDLENIDWYYVEITKQENEIYQLSVYSDGTKYVFNTIPVLSANQITGVFATLFNKYEKELTHQKSIAKSLNIEKMKLFRKSEDTRKASLRTYQNLHAKKSSTDKTRDKLIRSFQIYSFGMYNSDSQQIYLKV